MSDGIVSIKSGLRERLRARARAAAAAGREEDSARARALLARQRVWQVAKAVLFYAPLPDEIDLLPLLEGALAEGKAVALPRYQANTGCYAACQIESFSRDCAPGKFGIPEAGAAMSADGAEASGLDAGSWSRF